VLNWHGHVEPLSSSFIRARQANMSGTRGTFGLKFFSALHSCSLTLSRNRCADLIKVLTIEKLK
jgi:hypothetical protein